MYYLEGAESFMQSVLSLTTVNGETAATLSELRERYVDFSVMIGGEACRPNSMKEVYCYDSVRIQKLISKYSDYSQLTDINSDVQETPMDAQVSALNAVALGLSRLKAVNPELGELFDFCIHTLFYQRSVESGGGSVSSAPGVIWCSPRKNWTDLDIAEFLVHELSHNMLFVDERRYQHYLDFDDIAKTENFAISAVLNRPRPLDKAFHSLVVAHEIMAYRQEGGEPDSPVVHPKTSTLLDAAQKTVGSIRQIIKRKELVTARFVALLDRIEASVAQMNSVVSQMRSAG